MRIFNQVVISLVSAIGLFLFFSMSVQGEQITDEENFYVQKLINLSESNESEQFIADKFVQQKNQTLRENNPDISIEAYSIVRQETDALVDEEMKTGGLRKRLAHLIYEHYTPSDVKVMIEFYSTTTGKKVLKLRSKLMRESADIKKAWRTALELELHRRIEKRFLTEDIW